ncbi:MAG TPA: S8 family serine peptidase [Solirubrobacteraceae bacterium]|jgi:hypothetical protein|nr:S8 family serine peptidase [Solirubrobacteraceae bacterium]
MRVRSRLLVLGVVAASLVAITQVLSNSASASGQAATQHVIVVFKNQDPGKPATSSAMPQRAASFHHSQAPVVSQLSSSGAKSIQSYNVVDAVSATVSPSETASLKSNSAVSEVIPDQLIHLSSPAASGSGSAGGTSPLPGACGPKGSVQLDPQALETIGADSDKPGARTARSLGITGAGVKVAFIADGLDTNDPDFIRPNGQHVFVDYKDFSGFGTGADTDGGEAFLDSSSIAAQGRQVYDVSQYSADSLSRPCDIRVEGVAPGASLVGLDVFGPTDDAYNSTFLQAINYAVTMDHVNVLNESLGTNYYPDDQADLDLIKQANDAAVAAGTVVTVSSGDAGPTSTIGSPGTDPNVIDAGASTTFRGYGQTGLGAAFFPGISGWLNDNMSGLSSGGFAQDGQTVDLVAPGDSNWALCSTDVTMYADCFSFAGQPSPVELTGGTSEAAPLTAGVAALVIEAYRQTHGGATPSASLVKQLIVSNTDDIGSPADQQGSGRLDAYKAVLAAEHLRSQGGDGSSTDTVLDSNSQLNAVDQPGTREQLGDTITDSSGHPETLYLGTRAIGPYATVKNATATLSDSDPTLNDQYGFTDNYQTVKFNVPYGENRLSVSLAFNASPATAFFEVPQLTLIDPYGRLAASDGPQGNGNFGNSQVTDPTQGTWTALIYAPDTASASAVTGTVPFTGSVLLNAAVARYTQFGTVSPSTLHLSPGQSAGVTLRVSTPPSPGDAAGAIVIANHPGADGSDDAGNQAKPTSITSIPVTLRSLIPAGNSSFTGATTGGNGRAAITGQTFYYQLNVQSGAPELNARIALANNPNYTFQAWLVDPNGEAEAYASNVYISGNVLSSTPTASALSGAQLHVLSPAGGQWTLIVLFAPAAGGTQIAEPFTVSTDQQAVPAGAGGLPDAAATQLTASHAYTYDVTVKNTGSAPESFFPDARLPGSTSLSLGAVNGADTADPLNGTASNVPTYMVPTDSTGISAQASTTGSTAIQFDTGPAAIGNPELADPELASTVGTSASVAFTASPLSQGPWSVVPDVHGAFGATGPASEPVSTSASVTTSPFDPAITSPTGDLEADSADPATSLPNFAPITVGPGQTATIPVTITPSGSSGTQVTGTLYLDDYNDTVFNSFPDPVGDQVAALPYHYTIK